MPRTHPADTLRPIEIIPHFLDRNPASVLYSSGSTRVLCTAHLVGSVPPFLEGKEKGWCTAEYSLLPGSTSPRNNRERGKVSGRTQEIQRLIGRSLRGILDLSALSGYTLQVDCDVLQADGGTRTASINGGYVASRLVIEQALKSGRIERQPILDPVGAVSVGMVDGQHLLDLNYEEDSAADVDLNLVLTASGKILEIQGTAEGAAFSRTDLDKLVDLGTQGIEAILTACAKELT
jgi:ribonuclease PH